jgi:hypothetical protein
MGRKHLKSSEIKGSFCLISFSDIPVFYQIMDSSSLFRMEIGISSEGKIFLSVSGET